MTGNNKKSNTSRRSFLKKASTTAVVGAGLPLISASCSPQAEERSRDTEAKRKKRLSLFKKEHNRIDDIYEIDPNYKRMDQKNIVFSRGFWDPKVKKVMMSLGGKKKGMLPNPLRGLPGFSLIDFALSRAAWATSEAGVGVRSLGPTNKGFLNDWDYFREGVYKEKYQFESTEEANQRVVRAAKFLGASDAGIAPYDERWVYSKWYDGTPTFEGGEEKHEEAKFYFKPKSVIAMVHEMDYDAFKCPGDISDATVGMEYSRMAEVAYKVAVFINQLGYNALPSGNDIGMSIPTAIQAGLGEISRMGTMIHPKFGSRIRISKVYTDLEIQPNKPISFGVQDFCRKCKKCAVECPSQSISMETEPTIEPSTGSISSHPGVKKWYQNNETCFQQWEKLGTGCGICLAVCPYNKQENWVHHLSEMVVSAPIGRDVARQMDDAFGYGKITKGNVEKFWNKKTD